MLAYASALVGLTLAPASAATTTFETVPLGSPNGPSGVWNGQAGSGGLTLDGATFNNSYTDFGGGFFSWEGFAFSDRTDTTTAGFTNQYSAYPGGGAGGSSQYAVSYPSAIIEFATSLDLSGLGASIANTTYAALSMLNGDGFSKKFGGALGDDADFFKLTISGFSAGIPTGTPVDFYLADFRFTKNSQDYVVDKWAFVDLSPLGTVDEIRFGFDSSDVGRFGINTPTYFALDNFLAVPEPSAALLSVLGSLGLLSRRRR